MDKEKIKKLRSKIDKQDEKILNLLNSRAKVAIEIGKAKGDTNRSFHSPEREVSLLENLSKLNNGPFSNQVIHNIYREIMSGTLSLENPLKVAFLGPEGTFSHMAALKKFGAAIFPVPKDSIDAVFEELEKKRADYGIVPVENSIEGMVSRTLDLLIDTNLNICDEALVPIHLNLVSKTHDISKIKKIYSHYQPAAQCHQWLDAHLRGVPVIESGSSAKAAEMACNDKTSAAISSEYAASLYDLHVISERIEDNKENTTRFIVVGNVSRKKNKRDKTSLLISVKDKPGALFHALEPFASQKINLTKIESRPVKKRAWQYIFFVDIDGHRDDKKVKKVIEKIEQDVSFLKVLGSYPKGE